MLVREVTLALCSKLTH